MVLAHVMVLARVMVLACVVVLALLYMTSQLIGDIFTKGGQHYRPPSLK